MGISRDSRHKLRKTGGRMPIHQKKRKHESGRTPANTKLGVHQVKKLRVRGGNMKFRALRLDAGSFSWGSESITRQARILEVRYSPVSNELVRTNSLTKSTVVLVDATPFKNWYKQHYGLEIDKSGTTQVTEGHPTSLEKKAKARKQDTFGLAESMLEQLKTGRVFAMITSRPGQVGKADGYLLEGAELDFYKKKMDKKKKK